MFWVDFAIIIAVVVLINILCRKWFKGQELDVEFSISKLEFNFSAGLAQVEDRAVIISTCIGKNHGVLSIGLWSPYIYFSWASKAAKEAHCSNCSCDDDNNNECSDCD